MKFPYVNTVPNWSDPPIGQWCRRFAIFPVIIDSHWVWLEWYWSRSRANYFHERTQRKPE